MKNCVCVCVSNVVLEKLHIFTGHNSACLVGWLLASVFGIHAHLYSTLRVTKCCSCCHAACTSRYSHTGNWMLFYEWRGKKFGTRRGLWWLWLVSDVEHCMSPQQAHTVYLVLVMWKCPQLSAGRLTLFKFCENCICKLCASGFNVKFILYFRKQTEGPRSCIRIFRIWRRLYK